MGRKKGHSSHHRALAVLADELRRLNRSAGHSQAIVKTARRFLLSVGRRPIGKIARRHIEAYLASRTVDGCGKTTPAREASMLRVFFAVLVERELLGESPATELAVRAPDPRPPIQLTQQQVRQLLVASLKEPAQARRRQPRWTRAVALRNRALLELLYGVGLRDAEVRAAQLVDLDPDDASILVRAVKRGRGRRVPVPPSAMKSIRAYLDKGRPLFVEGRKDPGHLLLSKWGRPLSSHTSYLAVRDIAGRVGLRAHPHAFRRAIATHLMNAGVPVTAVQQLLGHASLETTARYLGVERDELHRTVALIELPDAARKRWRK